MIETAVHLCKNSGSSLFDDIDFYQKFSGFAYQEFPGFKGKGELPAIFLAEGFEFCSKFFPQFLNVRLNIPFLIRYFKSASKSQELQVLKLTGSVEKDFRSIKEHLDIQDIASGVHVNPIDIHISILHDPQNMRNLVNGNSKFGINMSYRNICVSAGHNVRIDPNTNRNFGMFSSKLL